MAMPFSLRRILFEEAVAEDAERAWVGGQLLDDQIVVLAGFDEGAVLADARCRSP